MAGNIQLWPPITINRIIQTLIYRLALHPLLIDPPIWTADETPVKITKFRNFAGIEVQNPTGLTLSIYPYYYYGGDRANNLTVSTANTALKFETYTSSAGGRDFSSVSKVTATIMFTLSAFGFSKSTETNDDVNEAQQEISSAGYNEQQTVYEYNYVEWMLRQYMELLARILMANDMRKLPRFPDGIGLLAGSDVLSIEYPTAKWEQGKNSVLHFASLLWQADYYIPREWKLLPQPTLAEMHEGNLVVGTIPGVDSKIYYDTLHHRYLDDQGNDVLPSQLIDPATGYPYSTLDADLISLIASAPKSILDVSFFFKV